MPDATAITFETPGTMVNAPGLRAATVPSLLIARAVPSDLPLSTVAAMVTTSVTLLVSTISAQKMTLPSFLKAHVVEPPEATATMLVSPNGVNAR